jgi:Na+/serine symporter
MPASGGSGGFGGSLLLLPIVWQGMYGRRRDLAATLLAATVTL